MIEKNDANSSNERDEHSSLPDYIINRTDSKKESDDIIFDEPYKQIIPTIKKDNLFSKLIDNIFSLSCKVKIIISSIIIFLLVFLVLFFIPQTHNIIMRTLLSNNSYYSYVIKSNLNVATDTIFSSYSDYINSNSQTDEGLQYKSEIQLSTDSALSSMLSVIITDKDTLSLLKNISHIGISSISRSKNGQYEMDGVLYINTNKILKLNVIFDSNKDILYYQIPALSSSWLNVNLSDSIKSQLLKTITPASISQISPNYLFSASDADRLLSDCIYSLVDSINNVEQSAKETLSINGNNYKCTKLSAALTVDTLSAFCDTLTEKINNNNDYKILLENFNINKDTLIKQLSLLKQNINSSNANVAPATITTWVNSKGVIIGNEIVINSSDNSDVLISCLSSNNKNKFNYEFTLKNIAGITSNISGTDDASDNKHSGSLTINIEGSKIDDINISYTDLEILDFKHGYVNGTIEIKPSGFSSLLNSKVTLTNSNNQQNISSLIYAGGKTIAELNIGYTKTEYTDFTIPDKSLSAKKNLKDYFENATIKEFKKDIEKNINNKSLYSLFNKYLSSLIPNNIIGKERDDTYVDDMDKYNIGDVDTSPNVSNKGDSDTDKILSNQNNNSSPIINNTEEPDNSNNNNSSVKDDEPTQNRVDTSKEVEESTEIKVDEETVKESGETSTAFDTADITFTKIKPKLESLYKQQFGSCPTPDAKTECVDTYFEDELLVSSYTTTYDYYFNDDYTEYSSIIVDFNSDKIAQMSISSSDKNVANAICSKYLELLGTSSNNLSTNLSNAYTSSNKTFDVSDYTVYATSDKIAGTTYYSISISVK